MNRGTNMQVSVPSLTKAVKWLIIVCVFVWFVIQVLLEMFLKVPFSTFFSLVPAQVLFEYKIWQIFTYQFLHSPSQVSHIVFNLLMLWFLGSELEQKWGTRRFLTYYLVNGMAAAVIYIVGMALYAAVTGAQVGLIVPVVGASGALFAVMVAYGFVFGERMIYFFMLFPMKAKYFVGLLAFIQVASLITSTVAGGEVAYLAHLGGLISGFVYLMILRLIERRSLEKRTKRKSGNLRLVVNNDKQDAKDPKYWN